MTACNLAKYEIYLYSFSWIAAICYSSYCVYLAGKLFDESAMGDDFVRSWFGFKKDIADYEWHTWLPFILYTISPWIAAHLIITEIVRWISPKLIPGAHLLITCSFILMYFGPFCVAFAVFQVFAYYTILRFKSVLLIWLLGIPFLLLSCYILQEVWDFVEKSEQLYTLMVVSTTWLHLRCTSFCLECLSSTTYNEQFSYTVIYNFIGYCFYLPTYFLGPFIIYSNFSPHMYRRFKKWSKQRLIYLVFNIVRYLFWAGIAEISLYFLFIHALQYHIAAVVHLGEWTLYGLGFLIGQFFYLKYIVVYGLAGTISNFEGYIAPPPPRCTARIHLYTDMWRVFDVGFYQFIHRYIYSPLCGGKRSLLQRLMASCVCFCFVFIWHGIHISIFIWSLLNFVGVSIICFGSYLSKTEQFINWEKLLLSKVNSRRLSALISAPMFIMGPISSFYFFSGVDVGNAFVYQLFFNGTWTGLAVLIYVSYCMCQVSIEIKNYEELNILKTKYT